VQLNRPELVVRSRPGYYSMEPAAR
jgi:hypothetical protein